jgi:hypothetical protein
MEIDSRSRIYPLTLALLNLTIVGLWLFAFLRPAARIRNAARIVDFPALLGPTIILKCFRLMEKLSKALNL